MTDLKTIFPRSAFVGFEKIMDELESVARHAQDHYPPTNILKTAEHQYLIELAVAGFSEDELDIEVKDRTLTVKGEHVAQGREYIHRGISTKKFSRSFRLSEYVEVKGAEFKNGLLAIELEVVIPEQMRPRKIPIGKYEEKSNVQFLSEDR
jgi:molecular chaperone IbpA